MEANASAIGAIEHVGVLVRDLERTMEHYANDLGIGPWAVYTLTPDWVRDMTVHGEEQGYVHKLLVFSSQFCVIVAKSIRSRTTS